MTPHYGTAKAAIRERVRSGPWASAEADFGIKLRDCRSLWISRARAQSLATVLVLVIESTDTVLTPESITSTASLSTSTNEATMSQLRTFV